MGKFSFTYGFIEARLWLPGVPGNPGDVANWPGLWTDGKNWPEDGEIDIAEGIHGQVCAHFHGPDNPSGVSVGCPSDELYERLAYFCRELGAGKHHLLL